jgi:hypothetical protein
VLVEGPASVVVVAAAGTVDEVDALVAAERSEVVVVDEDVPAPFTEVEVEDSRVRGPLVPSMTPVSRSPTNTPVPTMARRAKVPRSLLMTPPHRQSSSRGRD